MHIAALHPGIRVQDNVQDCWLPCLESFLCRCLQLLGSRNIVAAPVEGFHEPIIPENIQYLTSAWKRVSTLTFWVLGFQLSLRSLGSLLSYVKSPNAISLLNLGVVQNWLKECIVAYRVLSFVIRSLL